MNMKWHAFILIYIILIITVARHFTVFIDFYISFPMSLSVIFIVHFLGSFFIWFIVIM